MKSLSISQFHLLLITQVALFVMFTQVSPGSAQPVPVDRPESRGYLTTPGELREIARKAEAGIEPYKSNVAEFMAFIGEPDFWPYGDLAGEIPFDGRYNIPPQIEHTGAKLVYGKAIAWHLTGDERYAASARGRILDLAGTYGYDVDRLQRRDPILNLARGGTPYIYAADLLEPWDGWSKEDKMTYQRWLRDIKYPKVVWASRYRKNNWGTGGSFAAAAVADYLHDSGLMLYEVDPIQTDSEMPVSKNTYLAIVDRDHKQIALSPAEAYRLHNKLQIGRQSTAEAWKMDAKTPSVRGHELWGILPSGAIPEEVRRGDNPITAPSFGASDSGSNYSQSYIEHLTAHAEFLRRRGDTSLYDLVFDDGSGSLLQAIRYIVDNPDGTIPFTDIRMASLYIAYRYYQHPGIRTELETHGPGDITGQRMSLFGRLTHDYNRDHEIPGPPPVVPPPGGFEWPLTGSLEKASPWVTTTQE